MTTNVYDVNAAIIASDSRWSYTIKEGDAYAGVVYADDTDFDKMVLAQGACGLFAGNSKLIDAWKEWIRSPSKIVLRRPHTEENFAMCLVNAATGNLIFEHGQKIVDATYRFAGTGAKYAHTCWKANKDALRAVKSAADDDNYSGGTVKYVKIKAQEHNINPAGEFASINRAIVERGIVMYQVYDGKKVSIQDAAKTDPRIKALVQRIASGEASAEAPSGHDPVIWTETDVRRLDDSLDAFFGPSPKK